MAMRSSIRVATIAAAVATAIATPAHAFRVDYVIDAGIEHDDNVHVSANDIDGQRIMRAGFGFLATQEGSTLQAVVAGRADYRDFQRNVDSGVEGALSAYINWVVLQDRLSFTVQDELELQAIDRFAADAPDNRQQVNVLSFGPNVLFDIGSALHGRVEARYIDTDAEVTDEFNSNRIAAAARLTRDLDERSSLSFNGQWMDVDYDRDLVARDHERLDIYGSYRRTQSSTDYAVDVGYSRLDYNDGETRDGTLLRVETGWTPVERSRLALYLVNQFSDAADAALAEGAAIRPDASVPGSTLVDDRTIIPSTYRERRAAVAYTYAGDRVGLRIEPYVQRIRYIDAPVPDEESRGALLGLDYRLGPTLMLTGWAGIERIEYSQLGATDDIRRGGLVLAKQWTRHWSTSLSYYRYERDSGVFNNEVRQNVWYLWMSYRNRPL